MNRIISLLLTFLMINLEYVSAHQIVATGNIVGSTVSNPLTDMNSAAPIKQSQNNSALPRFASIKFNEVNTRTGPVVDCPIEWIFIKKGEPVEIVAEYGKWRKIKDVNGEGGWTHASTLSGKRFVVVTSKDITALFKSPDRQDRVIVRLSPGIRCALIKCHQEWCKIDCDSYSGWIKKSILWGVYNDE